MNNIFKRVLISGASALVGAVAGYIFCKKMTEAELQKKFEEEINAEIDRIRESHKEKVGEIKEKAKKAAAPNIVPPETTSENAYEKAVDYTKKFGGTVDPDYDPRAVDGEVSEADMTSEELDEIEKMVDDQNFQSLCDKWSKEPPYVIPVDDYDQLPPFYEKVSYRYFEDDDALVDDGNNIVDDYQAYVGDGLEHFGEEPEDADCVYICNGKLGLAIEVIRIHDSYARWCGLR